MRALPLACDSSAFGSAEAFTTHMTEGHRLLSLAAEHRELADGWELRFPGDAATLLACARWMADEGRCCPFLTFSLEWRVAAGDVWLRLTGPEGTKEVLRRAWNDAPSELETLEPPRGSAD